MDRNIGPVLILGGSGQVGYALSREARDRGLPAVGTFREHPQPGLIGWDGTAGDFDRLFDELRPSLVIHAAGWTDVEGCESDEARAFTINADLPAHVASRTNGLAGYLFYSTEYVFDGISGPYSETDSPHALSAYGRSKLAGERQVLEANRDGLVIRTTVVYGPDPNGKNFVAQVLRRLRAGERVRAPRDQRSSPTYSLDLASASFDLMARGSRGVWHVAGPRVMDRVQFALETAEVFRLQPAMVDGVDTEELHQKALRPLNAGLRIERLEGLLGHCMREPRAALEDLRSQIAQDRDIAAQFQ